MPPSSPPASDQTLDHSPPLSQPIDLHATPNSSEPHTSSMSSVREEPTSIVSASTHESTKPTQSEFSFLSLPPEIRNMIYHHIFTPVRDGTCLAIHAPWDGHRLQGIRRECVLCQSRTKHNTCFSKYRHVDQLIPAFDIPHNYMQSGVLRTCRTILEEATPVSLAHIHISMHVTSHGSEFLLRYLQRLLVYMRRTEGTYLSKLTYTCFSTSIGSTRLLSEVINRANIRIGYLVLLANPSVAHVDAIEHFTADLDSLEHKPARVEWLPRWVRSHSSRVDSSSMMDFNEAVKRWLTDVTTTKTTNSEARLPLLRDSLTKYFDQSSD